MSTLQERLRARAFRLATLERNGVGAKLALEAVDEIDRLRAEVARLTEMYANERSENERMYAEVDALHALLDDAMQDIVRVPPGECPYPIHADHSIKACVDAGDCGCGEGGK